MADTLQIYGIEFPNATGINATDDGGVVRAFVRPQGTKTISSNGTGIDVTNYAAVDVAVQSTGIDTSDATLNSNDQLLSEVTAYSNGIKYTGTILSKSSSDLTASGPTVTVPAGYYGVQSSKSVSSGTEGTPSASKGTVSDHSVSITPSVTNVGGYIEGGTRTGTSVTVSASELVSGTYSVTSSGTKDVTNYESVSVPSGSAATPATTVSVTPSISVSSAGLITATASGTKSVTPSVSAGYVSSGTAGTITVSGSNTSQLTTLGTTTYNTSSSDQTISSGRYLTGTQTIRGVTVSGLSAANIANGVTVKVGDSADDDRIVSVTGTLSFITYYTGSSTPSASLGANGDIYLKTS